MDARPEVLAIERLTLVSCLGDGIAAHRAALAAGRSGLRPCALPHVALDTLVGEVDGLDASVLPARLGGFECRNNRLAWRALNADGFAEDVRALAGRLGRRRVGVFIGSSTSGIDSTERAYRERPPGVDDLPAWFDYRHTHNAFSPGDFAQAALGLEGVAQVVATACSSSAKAFATAWRHLKAGLCDAALVGGVDSLCLTTLYGFNALELVAREPCRPWDADRAGISLAEAAGFALVTRRPADEAEGLAVLGCGESSDAHHMSAPHPEGAGAAAAMRAALAQAGLEPSRIDYVNLHGTGTAANDPAEDAAVVGVLGVGVPCRSTKGATGHTLGAAGIVELIVAGLGLLDGLLPAMPTTRRIDPALRANVGVAPERRHLRFALSNSFGFGGSNCCLALGNRSGTVAA